MVTGAVGVAAYEALRKMVVKDQDPQFGAPAGADHDGRGGSQAQRTRARDDQHRDRGGHTSHRVGGDQCPLRRQRGHPPSSRPGRIRR